MFVLATNILTLNDNGLWKYGRNCCKIYLEKDIVFTHKDNK